LTPPGNTVCRAPRGRARELAKGTKPMFYASSFDVDDTIIFERADTADLKPRPDTPGVRHMHRDVSDSRTARAAWSMAAE